MLRRAVAASFSLARDALRPLGVDARTRGESGSAPPASRRVDRARRLVEMARHTVRRVRGAARASELAVVPARRPAGPTIEIVPPPPSGEQIAAWLRALRQDEGCADLDGHRACASAHALRRAGPQPEVVAALEATVTLPRRPVCVRLAAVAALGDMAAPGAVLSLARMRAVTRRRLAWEGRPEDRSLLRAIDAATPRALSAGSRAPAKPSSVSPRRRARR